MKIDLQTKLNSFVVFPPLELNLTHKKSSTKEELLLQYEEITPLDFSISYHQSDNKSCASNCKTEISFQSTNEFSERMGGELVEVNLSKTINT